MSYENAARQQLRHKWWLRAVGILACLVVFITVYALVLPAITMEGTPTCGLEEHTHTDDCYEVQLTCTNTDPDHEHSDACYTKTVICGLEEHIHSDDCYSPAETLAADQEEPAELEETPAVDEADDDEDTQDADTAAEALAAPAPVLRAPLLGAGATDGSIMDGRDVSGANDWQIVSGQYVGRFVWM